MVGQYPTRRLRGRLRTDRDDDAYSTPANTPLNVAVPGVLSNDISPSGAPLTAAQVTGPAHAASFTLHADGSFAYTPVAGYTGPDSFTYTATDGTTTSSAATVNLSVTGTAAVAQPDTYSTTVNTPLTVTAPGVLSNDTGGPAPTAVKVTDPAHGSVTLNADGSFTYTPTSGYVGPDSFTYSATNIVGTSPAATVTIAVAGTAAVAQPDSYSTGAGTPLTVAAPGVLANDTGAPAPTAVKVTDPAHGAVTLNADGSFTYMPTSGFVGPDSFTYSATNIAGTSPATTVTIAVSAATLTGLTATAPGTLGSPPTIKVGQQAQLTATATLSDSSTPNVTSQSQWSSSNPAVASVDSTGKVTGLTGGTATITASYTFNGITKTGESPITVGPPVITGVQPPRHRRNAGCGRCAGDNGTNGSAGAAIALVATAPPSARGV